VYQPKRRRNVTTLVVLLLLAAGYSALLLLRHRFIGTPKLDGSIGVVLGLYICSQPAANMLDMILYSGNSRRSSSLRATLWWLVLNVVVLAAGCMVLILGTTRFAGGQF
jgi:hypothetical protein